MMIVRLRGGCLEFGLWRLWLMALSEAGLARLPQASIPLHLLASLDGTRHVISHHPQGPLSPRADSESASSSSSISPESRFRLHSNAQSTISTQEGGRMGVPELPLLIHWEVMASAPFLGLSDILQLPLGRPKLRPLLQLRALSDLRSGRLGLPNRRSMKSDRETR